MPSVHLVDLTYELFRSYFGAPPKKAPDGREVGASRGIVSTLAYLLREEGATHVACATDHVIRSFRNDLFGGYKTEEGMPSELHAQFPIIEQLTVAMGIVLWPMIEFEADDALAAGAAKFAPDADRVHICTVDKDLAQCVRADHVIMVDRRRKSTLNEDGVREKFGVSPQQIPDFLALVGDTADGYPGITGFGKKTAAAVLVKFGSIEAIPADASTWPKEARGSVSLAATLEAQRDDAMLYKRLATLRIDVPIRESLADLEWKGATPKLRELTAELGFPDVCARIPKWRDA